MGMLYLYLSLWHTVSVRDQVSHPFEKYLLLLLFQSSSSSSLLLPVSEAFIFLFKRVTLCFVLLCSATDQYELHCVFLFFPLQSSEEWITGYFCLYCEELSLPQMQLECLSLSSHPLSSSLNHNSSMMNAVRVQVNVFCCQHCSLAGCMYVAVSAFE